MMLILGSSLAGAGEIIIDPTPENPRTQQPQSLPATRHGQRLERTIEEARRWAGGGEAAAIFEEGENPPAAQERAAEVQAQTYQRGERPENAQIIIFKQGLPPPAATKARVEAHSWITPSPPQQSRCRTENTVGGIEGQSAASGSIVIQTTSGTVNVLGS